MILSATAGSIVKAEDVYNECIESGIRLPVCLWKGCSVHHDKELIDLNKEPRPLRSCSDDSWGPLLVGQGTAVPLTGFALD